jgi:hypothetical protein
MGAKSASARGLAARTSPRPFVDERRNLGHQFEEARHARADLLCRRLTAGAGGRAGGTGQISQVGLFGLVEVHGPSESVQDALGDAREVAAFELGVVLDVWDTGCGARVGSVALAVVAVLCLVDAALPGRTAPDPGERPD